MAPRGFRHYAVPVWLYMMLLLGVCGGVVVAVRWHTRSFALREWRLAFLRASRMHDCELRQPEEDGVALALEVEAGESRVLVELARSSLVDQKQVVNGLEIPFALRARARFSVPKGPAFCVMTQDVPSNARRQLKVRDVHLGVVEDFDDAFTVHCDGLRRLRQIWKHQDMLTMLKQFPHGIVSSDGVEVSLSAIDTFLSADKQQTIENAIVFVARLASTDLFGLTELRSVPEVAYQPPRGPWNQRTQPCVQSPAPHPVTLRPVVKYDQVVTEAVVEGCPHDWNVRLQTNEAGRPGESLADGGTPLPPGIGGYLKDCGAGSLEVASGRGRFTCRAIVRNPRRLAAIVRLLQMFARSSPGGGVYR